MNQFLSEIYEKYTKIVKSANLIGFLKQLVVSTSFAYFGQNYKNFNQLVNPLTVHLDHIKVKFEYQGHWVKVRII